MLGGDDRGRGRHLAADPQAGRGTGSLTPMGLADVLATDPVPQATSVVLAALSDQVPKLRRRAHCRRHGWTERVGAGRGWPRRSEQYG